MSMIDRSALCCACRTYSVFCVSVVRRVLYFAFGNSKISPASGGVGGVPGSNAFTTTQVLPDSVILKARNQNIWEEVLLHVIWLPEPLPRWGWGTPSPHPIFLDAFGGLISAPPLRISRYQSINQ